MADLLTHYVSARVAGIPVRDRSVAALLTVGVLLPDVTGKPLGSLPGLPELVEVPSHTLPGLLLLCFALCLLFAPPIRARAFGALYAGSLVHLLLDAMKDYLGSGAIIPFHPFSLEAYEMGFYRSEDVFYLLPANLAVLALLGALERRRRRAELFRDVSNY